MPKPLITRTGNQTGFAGPTVGPSNRSTSRLHTGRRSDTYLRALRALDTSGSLGQADLDRYLDDVRREFHERYTALPIGIVGKCHLGDPFEVHTLALDGSILEHYRRGHALPGPLERARALAGAEGYLGIEVYPDRLMCLRPDGSTVLLGSDS